MTHERNFFSPAGYKYTIFIIASESLGRFWVTTHSAIASLLYSTGMSCIIKRGFNLTLGFTSRLASVRVSVQLERASASRESPSRMTELLGPKTTREIDNFS